MFEQKTTIIEHYRYQTQIVQMEIKENNLTIGPKHNQLRTTTNLQPTAPHGALNHNL